MTLISYNATSISFIQLSTAMAAMLSVLLKILTTHLRKYGSQNRSIEGYLSEHVCSRLNHTIYIYILTSIYVAHMLYLMGIPSSPIIAYIMPAESLS